MFYNFIFKNVTKSFWPYHQRWDRIEDHEFYMVYQTHRYSTENSYVRENKGNDDGLQGHQPEGIQNSSSSRSMHKYLFNLKASSCLAPDCYRERTLKNKKQRNTATENELLKNKSKDFINPCKLSKAL